MSYLRDGTLGRMH